MISCRDAVNLLYEYLDGELTDVSEEEVRKHFEVCRRCFPHLKLEETFLAAVHRATQGGGAPEELRGRVMSLLSEVDEG